MPPAKSFTARVPAFPGTIALILVVIACLFLLPLANRAHDAALIPTLEAMPDGDLPDWLSRVVAAGMAASRQGGMRFDLSFDLAPDDGLADNLPLAGPASLTGDLAFTADGYSLSSVVVKLGDMEISGDIAVSLAGVRPALTASLHSGRLDLSGFFPEDEAEERPAEKVFSAEPLPFELLKTLDADLSYTAESVIFPGVIFDDLRFTAKVVDGRLEIETLSAIVANGQLVMSGGILAGQEVPQVRVDLEVSGLEPGLLPDFREINATEGSLTDIRFNAAGFGRSVAAIMGSLNGSFLAVTGEGKHRVQQIDQLGSDFVLQALNLVNPFRKTVNETQIMCVVIRFDIRDGVATSDQGLAAQTQQLNILGGGVIDLKTEQLDIVFHPEARSGISLSKISLVELVHIYGTLANQEVREDTQNALLRGIGTASTSLITGGVAYLVRSLFPGGFSKKDPCKVALREDESPPDIP